MRNIVKQQQVKEKIFSRVVFSKKVNQIKNRLKGPNNCVSLLKYGEKFANYKV